jgi:metal-sulfur cluster biosynthetic enzyme
MNRQSEQDIQVPDEMIMDPIELQKAVVEKLKTVIDPETDADEIRMRLVQNISKLISF